MPNEPDRSFYLHCDSCHHEVTFKGSMTRAHIGTPCPVCDADMLTEADYKRGARIQRVVRFLEFFGLVKQVKRDEPLAAGERKLGIHAHGNRTNVTIIDGPAE